MRASGRRLSCLLGCLLLAAGLLSGCLSPGQKVKDSGQPAQPPPDLSLREWWEGYGRGLLWCTDGNPARLFQPDGSPNGDSALYFGYFRLIREGHSPDQVTMESGAIGHSFSQTLVAGQLEKDLGLTLEQTAALSLSRRPGSPVLAESGYLFPKTLGEKQLAELSSLDERFEPKQVEIFREDGREVALLTISVVSPTFLDEYSQFIIRFEGAAGGWKVVSVSGEPNQAHSIRLGGGADQVSLETLPAAPILLDNALDSSLYLLLEQGGQTQLVSLDARLQSRAVTLLPELEGERFLSLQPSADGVIVRTSHRALLYNRELEPVHWITLPEALAGGTDYDLSDQINLLLAVLDNQLCLLDLTAEANTLLFDPASLELGALEGRQGPQGGLTLSGPCWLMGESAAALALDEGDRPWLCLLQPDQQPVLYLLDEQVAQYQLLGDRWLLGTDEAIPPSNLWWLDITSGSSASAALAASAAPDDGFVPALGYQGGRIVYFSALAQPEGQELLLSRLMSVDLATGRVTAHQATVSNAAPELYGLLPDGRVLGRYSFFDERGYFLARLD